MNIPWAIKRQLTYLALFLVIVFGMIVFLAFRAFAPTCFDNKQNQNEQGIDCGGPCQNQCKGDIKNLIVPWANVFKIDENLYEAIALVDNPNLRLAIPSISYQLKLYDKNNVLIAVRDGETFINSGEAFPIFETYIDTGNRVPERAFIEFKNDFKWEIVEKEKMQLVVSKKEFVNDPSPRLSIVIDNKSALPAKDIYAVAVLYDKDNNVKGASSTRIDIVAAGGSKSVVFTWPQPFAEELLSNDVFFRTGFGI